MRKQEVQNLLFDNKTKNNEVANTVQAKEYVENKFKFNSLHLKKLQAILLRHDPAKQGYRNNAIVVGNEEIQGTPSEIQDKLSILFRWYMDTFTDLGDPKFFGFLSWFWFYLIFAIVLGGIIRKLLKVV